MFDFISIYKPSLLSSTLSKNRGLGLKACKFLFPYYLDFCIFFIFGESSSENIFL